MWLFQSLNLSSLFRLAAAIAFFGVCSGCATGPNHPTFIFINTGPAHHGSSDWSTRTSYYLGVQASRTSLMQGQSALYTPDFGILRDFRYNQVFGYRLNFDLTPIAIDQRKYQSMLLTASGLGVFNLFAFNFAVGPAVALNAQWSGKRESPVFGGGQAEWRTDPGPPWSRRKMFPLIIRFFFDALFNPSNEDYILTGGVGLAL